MPELLEEPPLLDELQNQSAEDNMMRFLALCEENDLVSVRNMAAGVDIDGTSKDGRTPLIYAAVKGHTEIVQYLLDQNADVNKATPRQWGPLLYASVGGHYETAQALLSAKADPTQETQEGWTPITAATKP